MINRIGKSRTWIPFLLVALLTVPLIGWNALQKPASSDVPGGHPGAGNVERGRELFMGNLHFESDGPPCMGCHNVGSNGLLGGGALGPDLTNVSTKRSQFELIAILSNSSIANTPVMQPIYAEHPLTVEEQADLLAFINASVGQPESNKEWLVICISLAGFGAAALLLGFVYRNRLRGVRRALIRSAEKS